ncbi:MAG: radical SAM protein [Bacilli bacterium]
MNIVYANARGEIFDAPQLHALGRTGRSVTELQREEWMPLPHGASLVSLPDTRALGADPQSGALKAMPPEFQAVGALLPQGYTRLFLPAFHKSDGIPPFPLFGYTAVGFSRGAFYVSAVQSDDPQPWNPEQYDGAAVEQRVVGLETEHPDNRLYRHLATCALRYECVTSRNTFFGRREGAIPASAACNAGCIGCISEQPPDSGFPSPQIRMTLHPTVDEMAELMVVHLQSAGPEGIVSFGQGCEGEPATRGRDIAQAIRRTREAVSTGYININTNAGLTTQIKHIADAGLDLMRVSMISALPDHYGAYYQPRGYSLEQVAESAVYAARRGVIVSLNYLVFPGVSDTPEEMAAMIGFIHKTGIRLVQLRNLNIDPDYYLDRVPTRSGEPVGMLGMIETIAGECPSVRIGSYTHPPSWFAQNSVRR